MVLCLHLDQLGGRDGTGCHPYGWGRGQRSPVGMGGTYSLKIVCIVYFFGHKIVHVSRQLVLWRAEN